MISENDDAKFGQLQAADLAGYEASVRVILGQIMAVSTLPGALRRVFTDNPASADALRAAEASPDRPRRGPTSDVRPRVGTGRPADDRGAGWPRPQHDRRHRVQWADAATRIVAQEADAVVKLYQAGLLPASYALSKLGYSDDEIAEIRSARAQDTTTAVTPLAS